MNKINNNCRNSIQVAGAIFGGLLISLPAIFQAANAQQPTTQQVNPCPSIFYEEPHNSQVMVPQGCRPNAYTSRVNARGTNLNNSTEASAEQSDNQSSMNSQSGMGNSAMTSQSNMSNSSMTQGTPNSQVDPETGSRTTVPISGNPSQAQSSMNSQSSMSNSSMTQGTPNSQVDPETGSRTTVPISGNPDGRQSQIRYPDRTTPGSQTNRSNGNRYQNAVAMVSPTNGQVSIRLVNKTNAAIVYQVIGDTQLRTLAGRSEVMLQGLRTPTNVAFYRQDRGLLMVTPQTSSRNSMLDVTLQETTDFAMDRTSMRIENNGAVYLN